MAEGKLDKNEFRDMRIHIVEANDAMAPLGASSKMNTEWAFLTLLRDIGRRAAGEWPDRHFDQIGVRSTVDLPCIFGTSRCGAVV